MLLVAVILLFTACAGGPQPTPTATPPVSVADSSFADGLGLQIGFKLLYALDSAGENSVLGTAGLSEVLAAVKDGAAGNTDAALAAELGMQDMLPRQINDIALRMRQTFDKVKQGKLYQTWGLFVPSGLYIKETYNSDMRQSFQMTPRFLKETLTEETFNPYLGEWADDTTGGRVKNVEFSMPVLDAPFFVDILIADPDWQTSLEAGKTRPLPFRYEDGSEKAVPTMVCYQDCATYQGAEGSLAVLPTAGGEMRLVVMQPPDGMSLHDFIPVAAAKHDEWIGKAEWNVQRVLLPRFTLKFEGSVLPVLDEAGLTGLLSKGGDFSNLGEGLYFTDILHKVSLVVDESGVDPPDSKAPTYRQNNKDSIPTLAIDRPFVVALEKTDEDNGCGQVLMMGVVHDPLSTTQEQ
jgi:serine protease inhibitor